MRPRRSREVLAQLGLASFDQLQVVTDSDDLDGVVENRVQIVDHRRLELHGARSLAT